MTSQFLKLGSREGFLKAFEALPTLLPNDPELINAVLIRQHLLLLDSAAELIKLMREAPQQPELDLYCGAFQQAVSAHFFDVERYLRHFELLQADQYACAHEAILAQLAHTLTALSDAPTLIPPCANWLEHWLQVELANEQPLSVPAILKRNQK